MSNMSLVALQTGDAAIPVNNPRLSRARYMVPISFELARHIRMHAFDG